LWLQELARSPTVDELFDLLLIDGLLELVWQELQSRPLTPAEQIKLHWHLGMVADRGENVRVRELQQQVCDDFLARTDLNNRNLLDFARHIGGEQRLRATERLLDQEPDDSDLVWVMQVVPELRERAWQMYLAQPRDYRAMHWLRCQLTSIPELYQRIDLDQLTPPTQLIMRLIKADLEYD
jgi:hypothetical protein